MRRKKYKNFVVLKCAVFSALLPATVFSVFFCKMRPVIISYAVSAAETRLLNAANEAVLEVLNEGEISYEKIVKLSRDDSGTVTSAETDIVKMNSLKSLVAVKTAEIIDGREYYDFYIPLGTFFGSSYTNGYGPRLHFKMQLTATAKVDFSHEFKSAGINQVLHEVMINTDIGGALVITGFKDSINVKTSAVAAQTVIVGGTPDGFTQVIEHEWDETAGLVNDYGATTGK